MAIGPQGPHVDLRFRVDELARALRHKAASRSPGSFRQLAGPVTLVQWQCRLAAGFILD